jgi:hypothetical protein
MAASVGFSKALETKLFEILNEARWEGQLTSSEHGAIIETFRSAMGAGLQRGYVLSPSAEPEAKVPAMLGNTIG